MSKHMKIAVPKAGPEAFVEVDIEAIGEDNWNAIIMEGLKHFVNSRMSKVTGLKDMEGAELAKAHADAMTIATENVDRILNGKIGTKAKASKSKASGRETTVAVQLAREFLKNQMRIAGIRLSTVKASDITAAARKLVEDDPSYIEKARKHIAETEATTAAIDIRALIKESPELVAKLEAEKAKAAASKPLSAAKAGKAKAKAKAKPAPVAAKAPEHHVTH